MNVISLEVIIIFVLLLANGVFAMAEIAIVSSKKVRLQQQALDGDAKAKIALGIANSPGEFLSTVQIGITLVGILSGAFGGATIAEHLEVYIQQTIPAVATYAEAISVVVVVATLTYFSIIIGELVPKRIALRNPEMIARLLSPAMKIITTAARPFERVLTVSTNLVLKLFGVHGDATEPPITEEEVKSMVDVGTKAGIFDRSEQLMVESALSFADKGVISIMTLRQDIVWLDIYDSIETNRKKMEKAPHSHFPVVEKNLDGLTGTVHTKDLYCKNPNADRPLTDFVEAPTFIPETSTVLKVLEHFKRSRIHIAFVIDEFGSINGLVTLNDILEALVGDLPSDGNSQDKQIIARQDGSWYIDGLLPIDKFKTFFNIRELPDDHKYQTVAGLVLKILGRIPKQAETVDFENFKFEVADLDGNRIDKLILTDLRFVNSGNFKAPDDYLLSRHHVHQ